MPRLHVIDIEHDDSEGAKLMRGAYKHATSPMMLGLANNAGVYKAFLRFYTGIRAGALTDAEHEVVALITSEISGCEYCLAAHTREALPQGLSAEDCLNIRRGTVDDPRRQALIAFATAVIETDGHVSDEHLAHFRGAGFDDDAIIEVIAEIGLIRFANIFNHVHDSPVNDPAPPLL